MSGTINAKNLEMLLLMAWDSVSAQLVPETDSQVSKWERSLLDFYVTRGKKPLHKNYRHTEGVCYEKGIFKVCGDLQFYDNS